MTAKQIYLNNRWDPTILGQCRLESNCNEEVIPNSQFLNWRLSFVSYPRHQLLWKGALSISRGGTRHILNFVKNGEKTERGKNLIRINECTIKSVRILFST